LARPRVSKELNYICIRPNSFCIFFFVGDILWHAKQQKVGGSGGGEAPEKSRPKTLLQGKGFIDAPASFHLKPQTQKGV